MRWGFIALSVLLAGGAAHCHANTMDCATATVTVFVEPTFRLPEYLPLPGEDGPEFTELATEGGVEARITLEPTEAPLRIQGQALPVRKILIWIALP